MSNRGIIAWRKYSDIKHKGTSKNSFRAASGLIFLWTASQKTVNIDEYARFFVPCQRKIILAFASKAII